MTIGNPDDMVNQMVAEIALFLKMMVIGMIDLARNDRLLSHAC